MSQLGLGSFQKQHDFLVGIDSDGCAFDSMEIKHKECFIPAFIQYLNLQAVSKYAREACEFTNLYSKTRGAN
ncbi:MAG: HAD family hydrolase, partial [Planctomycetaceae bacterium]|nr:HAD family hydrolase [Planctomycetaceae bacterium]